ncbi:hypothetical protein FEZ51_02050 [Pediococcus stilesii]|uniref:Uncharacterized protein n=1 Tax=Pediococcus stilesii TaxID=331679 RepID=A0A5R9BYS8_9LACO|nr:hypothetical protein [Pediococcus stilesii]TLQ05463.1 hypothetical protein FEZ51_02050 [Pediococcus stilesii]
MKDEYYHLTYWGWNNDEPTVLRLCTKIVLVPSETMAALVTTNVRPPVALKFIEGDGQDFILNAADYHSLERIYGEINSQ